MTEVESIPCHLGPVTVRHLIPEDAPAYIALDRNPITRRFLNGPAPKSDDVLRQELITRVPDINILAIAETATDAYVGSCGILVDVKGVRAELYIQMSEAWCGKRVGAEILEFLVRFARAQGWEPFGKVHPENERSLRMLRRLGWTSVGTVDQPGNWQHGHVIMEPGAINR